MNVTYTCIRPFAGVDVAGGVCYLLWDRSHHGTCLVETRVQGKSFQAVRALDESQVFIRDNRAREIILKVSNESPLSSVVSARRPFGLDSSERGQKHSDLYLYASSGDSRIERSSIHKGQELIDEWKVLLSKTSSEHAGQTDKNGQKRVLSRIEVMPPGSVATESYLIVGPFRNPIQATHVAAYLKTRFVRFLMSTILLTQNITRTSFSFVPQQDWDVEWNDALLYKKYGLTNEEIAFIESQIKPMELGDE